MCLTIVNIGPDFQSEDQVQTEMKVKFLGVGDVRGLCITLTQSALKIQCSYKYKSLG